MLGPLAAAGGAYALAAWLAGRACRARGGVKIHHVRTKDGWNPGLVEYRGGDRGTVYLQHGLGSRYTSFDLHPKGGSLARWLAGRGWRVFAGNLRGRAPEGPRPAGSRLNWNFSDYLVRDVPAHCDFVAQETGGPFHFVGHSLGGILGLAYTAGPGARHIRTLTTLGSALHYGAGSSRYADLLKWRGILEKIPYYPTSWLHVLWGPLSALKIFSDPWHYNRENMDSGSVLAYHSQANVDLTRAELLELGTTFEGEGILCAELGRRLPELAARLAVPWLAIDAVLDPQCPEDTAAWTYAKVSAPAKARVTASKKAGFSIDYGHLDLVCGGARPRRYGLCSEAIRLGRQDITPIRLSSKSISSRPEHRPERCGRPRTRLGRAWREVPAVSATCFRRDRGSRKNCRGLHRAFSRLGVEVIGRPIRKNSAPRIFSSNCILCASKAAALKCPRRAHPERALRPRPPARPAAG